MPLDLSQFFKGLEEGPRPQREPKGGSAPYVPYPTLLSITAHARSGALDHAWRLFRDGGYDTVDDDPEILNVRGRLLKDRALEATGHERRRFYLLAADAYARAAEITPATYPLINAASLSLLAGRGDSARARALEVLDHMVMGEDEPDTPYWREATRAEALLVLGRVAEARAALTAAVAQAPRAWEDHASTLRQFGLILAELGEDAAWLDPFRPPRSLHFAGHMGLTAGSDALRRDVAAVLARENIGFGFGALAAGADIVIAEALLDHGAELHLVLPAPADLFREASVDRFGPAWGARFDRLLQGAESLQAMDASAGATHPLAIRLAAEVAVGGAVIKANTLMTEAVQLLILDRPEPAALDAEVSASAWIAAHWAQSGRRRHVIVAARERAHPGVAETADTPAPARLAAVLAVDLCAWPEPPDMRVERLVDRVLPLLPEAIAALPPLAGSPRWSGETLLLMFDRPLDAAAAALSLSTTLAESAPLRIGGHYGLVRAAEDPLGGPALLLGSAATVPGRVLESAPIGAVHVTEAFAAALHAAPVAQRPRTEYVGDLPMGDDEDDIRLFSLKR